LGSTRATPSVSPAPASVVRLTKVRRVSAVTDGWGIRDGSCLVCPKYMVKPRPAVARALGRELFRCLVNGRPDSHVRGAATDVAGHGGVDGLVARLRLPREQRRRGHDLAALAVPALDHVHPDPRLLHGLAR